MATGTEPPGDWPRATVPRSSGTGGSARPLSMAETPGGRARTGDPSGAGRTWAEGRVGGGGAGMVLPVSAL